MPPPPKTPRDLVLAPVAVEIDLNLQRFRDLSPSKLDVPERATHGPSLAAISDEIELDGELVDVL